MGEIKDFIEGLKELEFSMVSLEIGEESTLLSIDELLNEVVNLGVVEIGDTYFEELNFIANNGKEVKIFGFC